MKTIRAKIADDIKQDNQGNLKGFVEIDARYKREFNDFLELLKKDGVEIVLYLPPFHPQLYEYYLKGNGKFQILPINRVEDYTRETAKVHGAKVFGSYDPEKAGIQEQEFYDGMHVRDVGSIARIFR